MAPGQCAAWIFFAKVRERGGVGKIDLRGLCVQYFQSLCDVRVAFHGIISIY